MCKTITKTVYTRKSNTYCIFLTFNFNLYVMLTCPNCKNLNPNDAYFCHECGYKLRNKKNGWKITAIVNLILLIIVGCLCFYNTDYQDCINNLNLQINDLQSQLPQTYYTKYSDQYYYHICTNSYEKSSCYLPQKGSSILIYAQNSDGYGLTYYGWIPMECLEKQ